MTLRLPRSDWALMLAGALLLTLAYPPFRLLVPGFVCLVPAALLILRGTRDLDPWRRHLHQGFWYGVITHGALLYWLAAALWHYGRAMIALYVVAVILFGGASAVMFAIVGRIAGRTEGRLVVALPAGVVFLEWLAAEVGPIGFPWHQLALTMTSAPTLVQTADMAGAGGLGFLLAAINALLAMAWWKRRSRTAALTNVEVAFALVFLMALYGRHRIATLPLVEGARVAIVQPNVTADEKWMLGREDEIVERTARLTERVVTAARPEFVVWPETALPGVLRLNPAWATRLTQLAHVSGTAILTGGVEAAGPLDGGQRFHNAAFAFLPSHGIDAPAVHRKQKLVPMVEWSPDNATDLERTSFGGFSPGRSVGIADGPAGRYGVLICYELTFADLARRARLDGAELLVTLSNDAWFGRTTAPHQHFAHATLRAVENRVSVVRSANTGVSGIVDPLGRVVTRTDTFVEAYAVGTIQRTGVIPPAVHVAGLVGPLSLGLLLVLLVPFRPKRQRGTQGVVPQVPRTDSRAT